MARPRRRTSLTASLMESATDLYTENLVDYFAGDEEVTLWLEQYWLPEELQHGRALRRYVEAAWPQFDGAPDTDLNVSGADLVDWFCAWRERAKAVV